MTDSTTEQEVILTKEQAIELVGGKADSIHCFRNPSGMLVGANWSWGQFEDLLDTSPQLEMAGDHAASTGHPLVVWEDEHTPLFFGKGL